MENMNICYPLPGIDFGHLSIQVERIAMPSYFVQQQSFFYNYKLYDIQHRYEYVCDDINTDYSLYEYLTMLLGYSYNHKR